MTRFASLSSPDSRVRRKLQARLYYAREKNREARKSANAPISFSGAKLGNIDGGGSLPSGWEFPIQAGDFNVEIVAISKRNNLDTLTLRVFGSNSSGSTKYPSILVQEADVGPGEEYSFSMVAELLDETSPYAEEARFSLQSRQDGSYLSVNVEPFPQEWSNSEVTHVTNENANEMQVLLFDNSVLAGENLDVTIQIANLRVKRTG